MNDDDDDCNSVVDDIDNYDDDGYGDGNTITNNIVVVKKFA